MQDRPYCAPGRAAPRPEGSQSCKIPELSVRLGAHDHPPAVFGESAVGGEAGGGQGSPGRWDDQRFLAVQAIEEEEVVEPFDRRIRRRRAVRLAGHDVGGAARKARSGRRPKREGAAAGRGGRARGLARDQLPGSGQGVVKGRRRGCRWCRSLRRRGRWHGWWPARNGRRPRCPPAPSRRSPRRGRLPSG